MVLSCLLYYASKVRIFYLYFLFLWAMRKMFIYISFVMLFAVQFHASAQNDEIEVNLNKYEELCARCLELKSRVATGESVTKAQAQSQVAMFLNMNKDLKARQSEMTPDQSARFAAIGQWFTSGVRPEILIRRSEMQQPAAQKSSVQTPSVPNADTRISDTLSLGANVKIATVDSVGTHKPDTLLSPHVGSEVSDLTKKGSALLLASLAAPDMAYGVMAGYQYGRWGGYLSLRSNYMFGDTAYGCTSDGKLPSGASFWGTGESRKMNLAVCVGALVQLQPLISVYVGAGYGMRNMAWKDVDGNWAEVSDWSHRGLAAESGLLFSFSRLAVSVGISTVKFKTASFTCGVGIKF